MRALILLAAAASILCAQEGAIGRYPQIRAIIREAESAAKDVPILPDKSRPVLWAGNLYARAGYLGDADRAYATTTVPAITVLRARVVYGDLVGAEKYVQAIADAERRANTMSAVADLLWRTGETDKALSHYAAAKQIAAKIANPERRKQVLDAIDRDAGYAAEPPPYLISAEPHPVRKFDLQDSTIPLFPVTTDGFRDLDSKEVDARAAANAEFMTKVYDRIAAHDRDGLQRVADSASTPFQNAIGLASIEHIAIQANEAAAAEAYAKLMPETDADCVLAKAEALSAVAAAWLRKNDSAKAGEDFDAAINFAKSVGELPLGKVSVAVSIAAAEFKGGMVATSAETFRTAREMARQLPARPNDPSGTPVRDRRGVHYRDEAYGTILRAAIRAHDLGLAHEMAELWKAEGASSDILVVDAWLNANQPEEAVAFARQISDTPVRITSLLRIAQTMLDTAGAPAF